MKRNNWSGTVASGNNLFDLGSAYSSAQMSTVTSGMNALGKEWGMQYRDEVFEGALLNKLNWMKMNKGKLDKSQLAKLEEIEDILKSGIGYKKDIGFGKTEGDSVFLNEFMLSGAMGLDGLNTALGILGWESERNGINDGDQEQVKEGIRSANSTVEMVNALKKIYGKNAAKSGLFDALLAVKDMGDDVFNQFIANNFDHSEDNWKIVIEDGKIKLIDDFKYDRITFGDGEDEKIIASLTDPNRAKGGTTTRHILEEALGLDKDSLWGQNDSTWRSYDLTSSFLNADVFSDIQKTNFLNKIGGVNKNADLIVNANKLSNSYKRELIESVGLRDVNPNLFYHYFENDLKGAISNTMIESNGDFVNAREVLNSSIERMKMPESYKKQGGWFFGIGYNDYDKAVLENYKNLYESMVDTMLGGAKSVQPMTNADQMVHNPDNRQGFWANHNLQGTHKGIDISRNRTMIPEPTAPDVLATWSGNAKWSYDAAGWGNRALIDVGFNFDMNGETAFIPLGFQLDLQHMKNKGINGFVNREDLIGVMDTTGNSTGIHLHWEIKTQESDNWYLNTILGLESKQSGSWNYYNPLDLFPMPKVEGAYERTKYFFDLEFKLPENYY